MARMLPREAENGVGMNRSAREESVKRFERSNGLDTALYKTIPLTIPLQVSFLSAFFVAHSPLAKLPWRRKLFTVFLVIRQDKVYFDTCPIQLFFIMIVDVGTILFQLKSTVIASIEYLY